MDLRDREGIAHDTFAKLAAHHIARGGDRAELVGLCKEVIAAHRLIAEVFGAKKDA